MNPIRPTMKTIALDSRPLIMNTHPLLVSAGVRLRRVLTSVLLLALAVGVGRPTARAADANPPDRMTYQGYLADANGNPLAPTTPVNYDVVFRIYSDQTGGTLIWAEKQTVTVDKGQFSVVLGEGSVNASEPRPALNTVFGSATASDRFLDLTVTVGPTALNIAPRLRLVTSPYAFLASRVAPGAIAPSSLDPAIANGLWTASGANIYRSGGNVTVGTGAPLYPAKLFVHNANSPTDTAIFHSPGHGQWASHIHNGPPGNIIWRSANPAGVVILQDTGGNVGIVTGSPAGRLHVVDTHVNIYTSPGTSGGWAKNGLTVDSNPDAGYSSMLISSGHSAVGDRGLLNVSRQGASALYVRMDGAVGIGTTAPRAPLDVVGSGSDSIGSHGYLNTGGAGASAAGTFGNPLAVSIKASGPIHAQLFRAVSDARIKKLQGRSDGAADLATLSRVEITDYTHIDVIQGGKRPNKKVIGQQVEGIFPQAVSKVTDVVPDIYQKATVKDGWVKLATDLKVGERVRLIGEKQEGIHEVLEVREGAFRTAFQPAAEKVFVYGREVKDFRVVDYEAIAMLNVSATQELARRLAKVEQRESNLLALEEKAARVEKVERELAELKLLVSRLAAQRPVGRPAAEAGPTSVNPAAQQ